MTFRVIDNPHFQAQAGFTNAQFKKLDDLYCRASAQNILKYRTVECDFKDGIAYYTYYKTPYHEASFQFVIRVVGPRSIMYEVYKNGQGRIFKSGVFDRAYGALHTEISALMKKASK